MTSAWVVETRPTGLPTRAVANAALWLAVFLGGFVFIEPSPYDLYLAAVIPAWLLLGFKVHRSLSPLFVLMLLYLAGGVLAATQASDFATQPIYYAITAFLALSSIFFACMVSEDPRRADTIANAWIAAAICTTALGVAGYAGLTGELFTKYGRAAGGFQDPNVFGPFLVFPFLVLAHRTLTRPAGAATGSAILALVILFGILLSFSRAAWGLCVATTLLMGLLLIITEQSHAARIRFIVIGTVGLVVVMVIVAVALSLPAVSDLFRERAQIEQSYDVGHLGRFDRYAVGFNMMLDHPLGIGAIEFGRHFGEDEHDIWLRSLTTYGWLGFAAYLSLVVWTLIAAFPLLFRSGPLQSFTQIAYIVLLGHILIATIIDIDHWRHMYLLFGLLWGAIAADKMAAQTRMGAYAGQAVSAVRDRLAPLNR